MVGRSAQSGVALAFIHLSLFVCDIVVADAGWRHRVPPTPAAPLSGLRASGIVVEVALAASTAVALAVVIALIDEVRGRSTPAKRASLVIAITQCFLVFGRMAWHERHQPVDPVGVAASLTPGAALFVGGVVATSAVIWFQPARRRVAQRIGTAHPA